MARHFPHDVRNVFGTSPECSLFSMLAKHRGYFLNPLLQIFPADDRLSIHMHGHRWFNPGFPNGEPQCFFQFFERLMGIKSYERGSPGFKGISLSFVGGTTSSRGYGSFQNQHIQSIVSQKGSSSHAPHPGSDHNGIKAGSFISF